MTSQEFEAIKRAMKQQNDLAIVQELSAIKADVEIYKSDCLLACDDETCRICDETTFKSIQNIIDKHIKKYDA